jgi:hypothetical protein
MIWPGSAASIADWMLPPGSTDMVALARLESIAIMAIRISPLHIAGRELWCMSEGLISEHKRMIVTESGLRQGYSQRRGSFLVGPGSFMPDLPGMRPGHMADKFLS